MPSEPRQPPARSGRRERRREETAQRLLDAAVRLFADHGYANTTVEAITEAADVGKGTFFNYFPGKELVLAALAQRQVEKIAAAASHIDPALPVRAQIRAVVHQIAAGWLHSKRLIRTLLGIALTNETLTPQLEALLPRGRSHMLLLVQEGQRRGEIRTDLPAPEVTRMLQQFMFGTQVVWALHPDPDLDGWLDQALDTFFDGIAPRPAARAHATARGRGRRR
jgi:AcrR family transcriptional regulator